MSQTPLPYEHYPTSRPVDVGNAAHLDAKFRKRVQEDREIRELVLTAPDAVVEALPVASGEPPSKVLGNCTKIVHIVRHGNGVHNVMCDSWNELSKLGGSGHIAVQALFGLDADRRSPAGPCHAPLVDALRDAPLTEKGRQEASATRQQAGACGAAPTLLVVSPMRRAAETGIIVFPNAPRVVAHDGLHENSGLFTWDHRRDLKEIRSEAMFQQVDWSMIHSEKCPWWIEDRRETDLEMTRRLVDLMRWVRDQPETEIALASHSHILHVLLQCGLFKIPEGAMTVNGMPADSWLITGEMRSFHLTWRDCKRKREEHD